MTIDISLSFGTTIIASTFFFNSSIETSAILFLCRPSNIKGLVTTAIVRIPNSFAILATNIVIDIIFGIIGGFIGMNYLNKRDKIKQ